VLQCVGIGQRAPRARIQTGACDQISSESNGRRARAATSASATFPLRPLTIRKRAGLPAVSLLGWVPMCNPIRSHHVGRPHQTSPPAFIAALLNSQPMGFYPVDAGE